MPVICEQNDYALEHLDEKTIVGWMHGDEPDNAQSLGEREGLRSADSAARDRRRLPADQGQGPDAAGACSTWGRAWPGTAGTVVACGPIIRKTIAEYVRGGDIVSFDIYPAVHDKPAVAGKLWYVARGVDRLRGWAGDERIVWNCIECTRISNPNVKPTPQQVKAEVWMSIIHGSQGIIYFCHQFQPQFIEAGLLADEEMARAVGAINREIQSLAAVINSPTLPDAATVSVSPPDVSADMGQLLGLAASPLQPKNTRARCTCSPSEWRPVRPREPSS